MRALIVVVVAGILAATIGAWLPARPAAAADTQVQGVAIDASVPSTEYDRLAAMGTNTVYLPVYWQADNQDSNDVHQNSQTVSDTVLVADMQQAARNGMRVVLMPVIWCAGCPGGWRGNLQPSDPHLFLQNYTQHMLLHYAQLAQSNSVWLFFLGSEMSYLQPYADDWRQMASEVRQVYRGLITYQPNWDRTEQVQFWDALDLVAVSAYFPLTTTPRPSVDELKRAWRSANVPGWSGQDWLAILQRIVNATGKRLLIGEVGYRSSTTAAAHPYDEVDQSQTPDQLTQANAYQALLETFSPQSWWMGVIWWQWRGSDADAGSTDMSPKAKLAEQFLTKWWAQGWRPTPNEPTPNLGGSGNTKKQGGAVLGSRTQSPATRPGTTAGSTSTSGSTTTQQTLGDTAPVDSGALVGGDGGSAALGSTKSAHSGRDSGSRNVLVAVALVGLLGMGAALVNLARIRLRTPRPLI